MAMTYPLQVSPDADGPTMAAIVTALERAANPSSVRSAPATGTSTTPGAWHQAAVREGVDRWTCDS